MLWMPHAAAKRARFQLVDLAQKGSEQPARSVPARSFALPSFFVEGTRFADLDLQHFGQSNQRAKVQARIFSIYLFEKLLVWLRQEMLMNSRSNLAKKLLRKLSARPDRNVSGRRTS